MLKHTRLGSYVPKSLHLCMRASLFALSLGRLAVRRRSALGLRRVPSCLTIRFAFSWLDRLVPFVILSTSRVLRLAFKHCNGLPPQGGVGLLIHPGLNCSSSPPGLLGFCRLSGLVPDGRCLGKILLPLCATKSLCRFFGPGVRLSVWLGSWISSRTDWWYVVAPVWS